jgi:hypothetical protein
MNFHSSSRIRNLLVSVVLVSLVVASCGGGESDTSRSRNEVLPQQSAPVFYRSTVCTNFFGAYKKDMAAPSAEVTLRFCPEATKIVLQFGNENAIATDITTGDPQITIDGSSFIERGPLSVSVLREFNPKGDDSDDIVSVPLGDFVLSTASVEGETRLVGTWSTDKSRGFLTKTSRSPAILDTRGIVFYTAQLFDKYFWFARDRCRGLTALPESEAFNLEFEGTGLAYSLQGILGAGQLIGKYAFAESSTRQEVFKLLNSVSLDISNMIKGVMLNNFLGSCDAVRVDPSLEITNQQKSDFEKAAPLLRKAISDVHTNLCLEDPSQIDVSAYAQQYAGVLELVKRFELWRYSDEPDRGALESAQVQLQLLVGITDANWPLIRPTYGCEFQSWGQQVWTATQLNEYHNPTVVTSLPDTTIAQTTLETQAGANGSTETTIAQTTSSQATGVASVSEVVTPQAVAPLQPSVAAPAPVLVPTKSLFSVGQKMKFKTVSVLAGLTLKKGNTVKVSVVAASKKVCKASKATVVASKVGTCSLRVSVLQGKKTLKKATVSITIGN